MANANGIALDPSQKSFRAIHRWARIAPRKARLIADLVRGMPVNAAVAVLDNNPKRAAVFFQKVLKSAMANASQDLDVDLNSLFICESRVDEGPLLGGRVLWRPRAQGRATPIHKRTSHLHIHVAESASKVSGKSSGASSEASTESTSGASE
jgi:large subunit ribosomal protein L22